MNRYNNPKIIDHLASSYVLGLLKGRVKKRFEVLMVKMPFLRAHIDINNERLSHLTELLPDRQPSEEVWRNIYKAINTKDLSGNENNQSGYYSFFTSKLSYAFVALIVLMFMISSLYPSLLQYSKEVQVYKVVLLSESKKEVVLFANKKKMMMEVNVSGLIPMDAGKTATLWCIDKDKTKLPINMGPINAQGLTQISLRSNWGAIMSASGFAISIEPSNTILSQSTGEIIYRGKFDSRVKS